MKCNQSRPGFELVLPCPFSPTITITPRAPPILYSKFSWRYILLKITDKNIKTEIEGFLIIVQNLQCGNLNTYTFYLCGSLSRIYVWPPHRLNGQWIIWMRAFIKCNWRVETCRLLVLVWKCRNHSRSGWHRFIITWSWSTISTHSNQYQQTACFNMSIAREHSFKIFIDHIIYGIWSYPYPWQSLMKVEGRCSKRLQHQISNNY